MRLNFGKLKIVTKSLETLQKSSNRSSFAEKTLFELARIHLSAFAKSARFHLYSFQGPCLWYLC